jgi:hypothetical protein
MLGRVPDMDVRGGKLLSIRGVYVLKARSTPP